MAVSIASFEISPAQSKPELISKLLSTYAQYGILNGSVLIAERGKLVFEKGFGFADIEWNVPNEVETKFNLASVTKQFVAMLVLQQVEKGTIKLEDRITDYLPGYPARTGNRITIHQLLNHTSGIPNYTDLPSFDNVISRTPYPSPQAMVRVFSDSALQFDPGTKYSYNNSAYFLLGVILEKVTGKKFDDLLHANILGPLGLKNTGLDDQYALLPKRAMGYNRGVLENNHAGVWDRSSLYTAGGMYSTVEDMYRWEQSLYTDKLLPDRYRSLLFTPSITIDSVTSYGYGWVIKRMPTHIGKDSVTVTYHTGTITGFNALIFRIPERRQTFIFLNNILVGRERLIAMATGCMNILNGAPYEFPRRSLAENLGKVYLQDGIGSAVGKFPEMKRDTVHFELVESEMNDLGYQLLRSHRQKDALEIFKLNSAEFPLSSNAFDSEGEAFLSLGDTTNAAMSYSRSVQLDSTNFNGREILRRLKPR
ncbi:MAG TPA: serine hydrolase domain-containing protein [Bacteroidota bacterium]|nr:serine hydrolase domain-containing protein [Bacteroidota bacterium]